MCILSNFPCSVINTINWKQHKDLSGFVPADVCSAVRSLAVLQDSLRVWGKQWGNSANPGLGAQVFTSSSCFPTAWNWGLGKTCRLARPQFLHGSRRLDAKTNTSVISSSDIFWVYLLHFKQCQVFIINNYNGKC